MVVMFRVWYGNLGEVKSKIASEVPPIVLMATSSLPTQRNIFRSVNLNQSSCVLFNTVLKGRISSSVPSIYTKIPVSFVI